MLQQDHSPESATQLPQARNGIRKWILLALVLAGAGLFLVFRASTPVMFQPLLNGITPYKPSIIHRWIPPTWGWFWRLKESLLGRKENILLHSTIFECRGLSNPPPA